MLVFVSDFDVTISRYRHAADKLQKTENVMEKYKKKLQEAADMRQQVKVWYLSPNMRGSAGSDHP